MTSVIWYHGLWIIEINSPKTIFVFYKSYLIQVLVFNRWGIDGILFSKNDHSVICNNIRETSASMSV